MEVENKKRERRTNAGPSLYMVIGVCAQPPAEPGGVENLAQPRPLSSTPGEVRWRGRYSTATILFKDALDFSLPPSLLPLPPPSLAPLPRFTRSSDAILDLYHRLYLCRVLLPR